VIGQPADPDPGRAAEDGRAATLEALPKFKPLMILRYSATHKTQHNKVHRLDALDAYNQKLVKKIAVRGIQTRKGLAGTNAYLYLEGIEISKKPPVARIELEVKLPRARSSGCATAGGRRPVHPESGGAGPVPRLRVISQIDAVNDTVEFTNGVGAAGG
jgi:type III restriction enzyme